MVAPKLREGSKQVILYEPDNAVIVKEIGGGGPCILTVFVIGQPKPSIIVIVVIPIGRFVATRELPEIPPGAGLHVIEMGTEAEPVAVKETEETLPLQPACVTDAVTFPLEV